ncbi:Biotin synthesis protein BioC [Nitrincola lacisaponensis]|uniref:Malonyl-[acyl-carrier protein] O-methyltransferase n=1 Tax=Nitrincola lacisaponensis TaxID=267850 RepID=A0A063Y4S3_9GAMM|nr:malonyl-ACP O-methyltransferase BioC [Nitrincola lacisaponensis]KDE39492.1 Biotin synthesis protein BioC [Nitrincola lacisaponensis]
MNSMTLAEYQLKQQVAASFSRAAPDYDRVAELQRQVADTLLRHLPAHDYTRVLDLGTGTGYGLTALRQAYPRADLIALDIAEGMLRHTALCQAHLSVHPLCADAESLPLADQSLDLICSSLAVQWCQDYPALFSECARVLRPGGELHLATLGPESLWQLRQAWRAVDAERHVNEFVADAVLLQASQSLRLLQQQTQCYTLEYDNLMAVLQALKTLGASVVIGREATGLGGRRRLQALAQAYATLQSAAGRLPLSYQVYYFRWRKE